jgi:DNA-binding MarR family transcriptional regulator
MQLTDQRRETLAQNISQLRRAIWRELLPSTLRAFGDFDFSMAQMAALLLLEDEGELTIKQVAEQVGRSVSATGRLLDQLVKRDLVSRREDERDRRAKRVAITEQGRTLLATLERRRVDAQLRVMDHLSAEEQADVARAMALLAEASSKEQGR